MEHFAGLDISVKETSVCIVDDTGKIVREVKVASEPGSFNSTNFRGTPVPVQEPSTASIRDSCAAADVAQQRRCEKNERGHWLPASPA
jgi:hypothetical protein